MLNCHEKNAPKTPLFSFSKMELIMKIRFKLELNVIKLNNNNNNSNFYYYLNIIMDNNNRTRRCFS